MALIYVEPDAMVLVARELLKLTSHPHDVNVVDAEHGRAFQVPNELAERFLELSREAADEDVPSTVSTSEQPAKRRPGRPRKTPALEPDQE